jgi:hypothetical protein
MKPIVARCSVLLLQEIIKESPRSEKKRYSREGQGQRPKNAESNVQTGHDEIQAKIAKRLRKVGSFN